MMNMSCRTRSCLLMMMPLVLSSCMLSSEVSAQVAMESSNLSRQDTSFDRQSGWFRIVSEQGITLEEGYIGIETGRYCSTSSKNGIWVERYRSGSIKSTGTYYCGRRHGIWVYFDRDGSLRQSVQYTLPFIDYPNIKEPDHLPARELLDGNRFYVSEIGDIQKEERYITLGVDTVLVVNPQDFTTSLKVDSTYVSVVK